MKIIFGESQDRIEEHASALIAKYNQSDPIGIAHYSAQVPQICDDCGETYWHRNDPYGWFPHIGCKGTKAKAGF